MYVIYFSSLSWTVYSYISPPSCCRYSSKSTGSYRVSLIGWKVQSDGSFSTDQMYNNIIKSYRDSQDVMYLNAMHYCDANVCCLPNIPLMWEKVALKTFLPPSKTSFHAMHTLQNITTLYTVKVKCFAHDNLNHKC